MTSPRNDGETPATEADRLALVVVNFASSSLLAANLVDPDLRGVVGRIVVVDNPSTIEETRRIRELCVTNGLDPRRAPAERGVRCGRECRASHRARELGCTRVLALNPDATIDADSVRMLLDASRA